MTKVEESLFLGFKPLNHSAMSIPKVLFICVHNSARSRMAEGFVNARCGGAFEAQSAGLEAGRGVNPLAAAAMQEIGYRY